ncbi:MAG: SRPBCC domain-containing protein, partial [Acidimicrobiia bacterium]
KGAEVTPLVSEFIVEAQAGGTCVVRVVSSAFGTGADWEQEFFDDMENGWVPFFDHLRIYLQHFPGQQVTRMDAETQLPGPPEAAVQAMQQALGIAKTGQQLDARGLDARVEAIEDKRLLLRVTDPVPGYLALLAWDIGDGRANATVAGYLFSERASAYVEAERSNWKAWLDDLSVHTA